MSGKTREGKAVTFRDAVALASKVGIKEERTDWEETAVVLVLADGRSLHFYSNYDGPYSENTPGNGIELPTVYLVSPAGSTT
jgi:Mg-chelatase subunit ChlD